MSVLFFSKKIEGKKWRELSWGRLVWPVFPIAGPSYYFLSLCFEVYLVVILSLVILDNMFCSITDVVSTDCHFCNQSSTWQSFKSPHRETQNCSLQKMIIKMQCSLRKFTCPNNTFIMNKLWYFIPNCFEKSFLWKLTASLAYEILLLQLLPNFCAYTYANSFVW